MCIYKKINKTNEPSVLRAESQLTHRDGSKMGRTFPLAANDVFRSLDNRLKMFYEGHFSNWRWAFNSELCYTMTISERYVLKIIM